MQWHTGAVWTLELEVDCEKNPLPLLCLAFWLDALPTELSLLAVIDSTEFSGVL